MVKMKKKKESDDPLQVIGRSKGYSQKELINQLPRHEKCTPHIIKQIKSIPDVVLRNLGTPIAKKAIKMIREVYREAYRAKQFTRTNINDHGVLYGVVLLKHKVIDLVLDYFHERWPNCIVCLYNEHTQKTGIITEKGQIYDIKLPLEKVVEKISDKRPKMPYFEDIQLSGKEIFETFYKTQNINERENSDYFKSMIPEKCFKLPGMRDGIEKRFSDKNKRLDEFL
jgi:hypothetical protein